jgi:hypothetical protein
MPTLENIDTQGFIMAVNDNYGAGECIELQML